MKKILFILFSLIATTSYAQESVEDSLYYEFIDLEVKDNYDSAYTVLKKCYELYPEVAELNYQIALYERMFGANDSTKEEKDYIPEVVRKLRYAFDKEPNNKKYAETLLNMYAQNGDSLQIKPMLEHLLSIDKTNEQYMTLLMRSYENDEEYAKELEMLERYETVSGRAPETEILRVELYSKLYNEKKALKYLQKLMKKEPHCSAYHLYLAEHYAEKEKFQEALKEYEKVQELNPSDVSAKYSYINCLEKMGKEEEARQLKTDIINDPKASSELRIKLLGEMFEEMEAEPNGNERMVELFRTALSTPQENTDMTQMFVMYMNMKEFSADSIVHEMSDILEKDPTNEQAYRVILGYHGEKDNKEEVINTCQKAIDNGVKLLELYFYQGAYQYNVGKKEEALRILQEGVSYRQFANDTEMYAECYNMIGAIYHDMDSIQQCYDAFDECLRWNPDNIETLNNYAYYLSIEGGDLEKAERMSKKTIEAEPNRGIYLDTYAWILYQQKNYTEAVKYINRAIADTGNVSSEEYDHAGAIYFMLGEEGAAEAYWELAVDKAKEEGQDSSLIEEKLRLLKNFRKKK